MLDMKKLIFIFSIIVSAVVLNSCSKDEDNNYPYQVKMTDAPGPYDQVNVEVIGVEVTGPDGRVNLSTFTGIYDLLDLTNGTNVIIANAVLHDARVNQIRLILGTNNTVVIGGVSYPLTTPSADQSGLKLLVNQTLEQDINNEILLDFDANQSILLTNGGGYKLKPVIRTIVNAVSGNISGTISPAGTMAVVTATDSNNISYSSNVNTFGQYMISGILPGTYTFVITPTLPLTPITITNVIVTAGGTTTLVNTAF